MRKFSLLIILLSFTVVQIFISCKKENVSSAAPAGHLPANKSPIANAGPDINIGPSSCASLQIIYLDGSRSYDPDSNKITFQWSKISGPDEGRLNYSGRALSFLERIQPGLYSFELKVTDSKGSFSKDTMFVDARNWSLPEFNININITASYKFDDNYRDCSYFPDEPCFFSDRVMLTQTGSNAVNGNFLFFGNESSDTSWLTNNYSTFFQLKSIDVHKSDGEMISGFCSVFFKQLIQRGGGPFTGTYKVINGSAEACNRDIYINNIPLTVAGILDTATHTVNMNIAGRTYF